MFWLFHNHVDSKRNQCSIVSVVHLRAEAAVAENMPLYPVFHWCGQHISLPFCFLPVEQMRQDGLPATAGGAPNPSPEGHRLTAEMVSPDMQGRMGEVSLTRLLVPSLHVFMIGGQLL